MVKKRKSPWAPLFMTAVLLFMYAPILVVVLYSFNANTARNAMTFTGFTLDWYRELFQDTRGFGEALRVSVTVALYSCGLSAVLGTLGAIGMVKSSLNKKGKPNVIMRLAEGLTTLPIMIPEIVLGMALMSMFYGADMSLGIGTLIFAHTTFCVPYIFIIVKGRLAGMDPSLEEAARDLGASPKRVLFDITLPLIRPGIISGIFLALAMSLDDFIISFFVTGAGAVTLPLKIYSSVKTGVSPQINALCTLVLVTVFIAVAFSQLAGRPKKQQEKKSKVHIATQQISH